MSTSTFGELSSLARASDILLLYAVQVVQNNDAADGADAPATRARAAGIERDVASVANGADAQAAKTQQPSSALYQVRCIAH